MTPTLLAELQAARGAKRPVALATRLADGAQWLLPSPGAPGRLQDAGDKALAGDLAHIVELGGERWFVQAFNPPMRLLIVGAVHIAQALAGLAPPLGLTPTIVDPRRAFATAERFPGVAIVDAWPDEAMQALGPDARTAVVTLTHDPKLDDPALDAALRSRAFYVGSLGSRKTHAARLERLRGLGHDEPALARIHGPVGISIGAVSAPEIALSIMAQIVAVRRKPAK